MLFSIAAWLCLGHHMKKKLKYQGVFSSWYAPLSTVNERGLCISIALLGIYSATNISNPPPKDLIISVIAAISVNLFSIEYFLGKGIPLRKTILLFSSIEAIFLSLFIFEKSLHKILQSDQLITFTISEIILILIIYTCNYYCMKNFIFYQKLISNYGSKMNGLSYNQKLNIAVHEASHLLMYSFYEELPHDIQILLFNEARKISPNAHGLVIAKVPIYNSANFIKWQMMLSISGIRGELLIFNAHSHGSESDFQQWRELAYKYLTKYEERFKSQPISTQELNINKELESNLYNEQIYIIDKFLNNNKSLLLKIARQSLVFNKMGYLQIHPHFKKIKKIKEMPKEF